MKTIAHEMLLPITRFMLEQSDNPPPQDELWGFVDSDGKAWRIVRTQRGLEPVEYIPGSI